MSEAISGKILVSLHNFDAYLRAVREKYEVNVRIDSRGRIEVLSTNDLMLFNFALKRFQIALEATGGQCSPDHWISTVEPNLSQESQKVFGGRKLFSGRNLTLYCKR